MASKNTVKEWFRTGFKPTQVQFYSFFDSIFWKSDKIPTTSIDGFSEALQDKADAEALSNHLKDLAAHQLEFNKRELISNKTDIVLENTNSTDQYPSVKGMVDWVNNNVLNLPFLGAAVIGVAPTGTSAAYWITTVPGTYPLYGGVVVNSNSIAVIIRNAEGAFSISQTQIVFTPYLKKEDVYSSFVKRNVKNKNLFSYLNIESGYYINPANGVKTSASGWFISEKIKLKPSLSHAKVSAGINFYDVNDVFISTVAASTTVFTTPSNMSYAILSTTDANLYKVQLEEGTVGTSYEKGVSEITSEKIKNFENEVSVIVGATKLSSVNFKNKVVFTKEVNKNLFNYLNVELDYYINPANGVKSTAAGWFIGEKTTLKPLFNYAKANITIALYDGANVFISSVAPSALTFTTPSNVSYGIPYSVQSNLNTAQIEEGVINTVYENGAPLINRNQIKGNNGSGLAFKYTFIVAKVNGDFSSIKEAITYIYTYFTVAETLLNPITVLVMAGTYGRFDMTGGRKISVIGVNREECIIKDTTGDYFQAPVHMAGPVKLENFTVIATSETISNPPPTLPSYAIHHDFTGEGTSIIRHCNLISMQNCALGIGLRHNQQLVVDKCDLFSLTRQALLMHPQVQAGGTNQKMVVKSCILKSDVESTLSLIDSNNNGASGGGGDNRDTTLTFYNNIFYSKINGKIGQVYGTEAMGLGDYGHMQITKDSYGNNIQELNR